MPSREEQRQYFCNLIPETIGLKNPVERGVGRVGGAGVISYFAVT